MRVMLQAPRIETDRLILTWPTAAQIDGYHAAIVDTNLFDTILWDGPSGPQDLHVYWDVCAQIDPADWDRALNVAIIERASERYIGGASLRPVDANRATIDIGYALAPHSHGRGYATEAVGALIDEAFARREAERDASALRAA